VRPCSTPGIDQLEGGVMSKLIPEIKLLSVIVSAIGLAVRLSYPPVYSVEIIVNDTMAAIVPEVTGTHHFNITHRKRMKKEAV
jgi:hypothetical protein